MALMAPVADEGFLQDIIRIGIGTGPTTRDQAEPGSVLGQPGLPVAGCAWDL
jgi:hypothetical protein